MNAEKKIKNTVLTISQNEQNAYLKLKEHTQFFMFGR